MPDNEANELENPTEEPVREPTTWEKWSILLVAIVAFIGIGIMCLLVIGLAITRNS